MTRHIYGNTKQLRKGVEFSETEVEVHWEPLGHISARLLDASGTVPLVGREVKVDVPGEGTVELKSDSRGHVFYPDVPFQDYELHFDDLTAMVPAVARRREIHHRP